MKVMKVFQNKVILTVTPYSVLSPQYSLCATVPYASLARAWRLKEHTKETWVIQKEISGMLFI